MFLLWNRKRLSLLIYCVAFLCLFQSFIGCNLLTREKDIYGTLMRVVPAEIDAMIYESYEGSNQQERLGVLTSDRLLRYTAHLAHRKIQSILLEITNALEQKLGDDWLRASLLFHQGKYKCGIDSLFFRFTILLALKGASSDILKILREKAEQEGVAVNEIEDALYLAVKPEDKVKGLGSVISSFYLKYLSIDGQPVIAISTASDSIRLNPQGGYKLLVDTGQYARIEGLFTKDHFSRGYVDGDLLSSVWGCYVKKRSGRAQNNDIGKRDISAGKNIINNVNRYGEKYLKNALLAYLGERTGWGGFKWSFRFVSKGQGGKFPLAFKANPLNEEVISDASRFKDSSLIYLAFPAQGLIGILNEERKAPKRRSDNTQGWKGKLVEALKPVSSVAFSVNRDSAVFTLPASEIKLYSNTPQSVCNRIREIFKVLFPNTTLGNEWERLSVGGIEAFVLKTIVGLELIISQTPSYCSLSSSRSYLTMVQNNVFMRGDEATSILGKAVGDYRNSYSDWINFIAYIDLARMIELANAARVMSSLFDVYLPFPGAGRIATEGLPEHVFIISGMAMSSLDLSVYVN